MEHFPLEDDEKKQLELCVRLPNLTSRSREVFRPPEIDLTLTALLGILLVLVFLVQIFKKATKNVCEQFIGTAIASHIGFIFIEELPRGAVTFDSVERFYVKFNRVAFNFFKCKIVPFFFQMSFLECPNHVC